MEGGTILAAYFAVNVLLLLALLLFMTGRQIMSSSAVEATFTQQRHFCQMVLLATLMAPMVVMALSALLASPLLMPLFGLVQPGAASPLDDWPIIQVLARPDLIGDAVSVTVPAAAAADGSWIGAISQSIGLIEVIMFLVGAGALVVLVRFAGSMWMLRRLIVDSVSLRSLGRVSILVSDRATVPFSTMAFGRALVILPTSILSDARDTDIAIRHELQHHRQHDTLWALVVELFRMLFFWNPAFYLWSRQLSQLQELSCDEELIRRNRCSANDYGGCLLRVAEAASPRNRRLATVGIVAMTAAALPAEGLSGLLHLRVERLFLHGQPDSARWFVRSLYLGVLLILLAITQLAEDSRLYLTGGAAAKKDPLAVVLDEAPPAAPVTPAFTPAESVTGADKRVDPVQPQAAATAPVEQTRSGGEPVAASIVMAEETPVPALRETRAEDIPALARALDETPPPAAAEAAPFAATGEELRPLQVSVVDLAVAQSGTGSDAQARFGSAVASYQAGEFEAARDQFAALAHEGHHNAQFNLGLMHYRGEAMEKDLLGAYAWIRLAALDGDTQKARVAEILSTMLGYRLTQKGDSLALELQPGADLDATEDFDYAADRSKTAVNAADEMRRDMRKMGRRTGSRLRSGLTPVGRVIVYDRHGMATNSGQLARVPGG